MAKKPTPLEKMTLEQLEVLAQELNAEADTLRTKRVKVARLLEERTKQMLAARKAIPGPKIG